MRTFKAVLDDHDRIDAELTAFEETVAGPALDGAAAQALTVLARRLRQHARLEEELVFPAAEQEAGDAAFPPTRKLRAEHQTILTLLVELEGNLEAGIRGAAASNVRELRATWRLHERKERQVIYPLAERALETSMGLGMLAAIEAEPDHGR